MSLNTNIAQLDSGQIIKRVYDSSNDSIRADITTSSVAITLDNSDNIVTLGTEDGTVGGTYHAIKVTTTGSPLITPNGSSTKASLTNASTGVVVAAMSCVGMKSFNLYTNTTSTITGAQVLTVSVSPSDTDNIWIDTALTITESTVNATVIVGTVATNIVARRVRVSIAAAITTGTFDVYLLMAGV